MHITEKALIQNNNNPTPQPFLRWQYDYNEKTGKHELKSLTLSDESQVTKDRLIDALKRTTGTTDIDVGETILKSIAYGMTAESHDLRINRASSLLPALHPNNEIEALLFG